MGGPMALNLLKAGHQLSVFDLSASASKVLAEAGAQVAPSGLAAVGEADIVVSMLPAGRHVEALYLGAQGIIGRMRPGTLIIECSTIASQSAIAVARAAGEAGLAMLDAPVSGGTGGAIAGTLTFMVGGPEEVLERARPVLLAMGKNIFHAGAHGAGQIAKICNNMLLGILMAGTAEALALGMANGLDARVLSDIMNKSSGRNWVLDMYNPIPGVMDGVPASRGYTGGFGVDLMLKDLGLAAESAMAAKSPVPLGELALFATLPKQARSLPERHLGLVLPSEVDGIDDILDQLADQLNFDEAAWSNLRGTRLELGDALAANGQAEERPLAGRKIAIARDAAFMFLYPANLETLAGLGATLEFFSPLADEPVPAGADAVYLPGGYPELHAEKLAYAQRWQESIRAAHRDGTPIVAECGGMMALAETLVDKAGAAWNMAAVLIVAECGGMMALAETLVDKAGA
eukprot:gene23631-26746_t